MKAVSASDRFVLTMHEELGAVIQRQHELEERLSSAERFLDSYRVLHRGISCSDPPNASEATYYVYFETQLEMIAVERARQFQRLFDADIVSVVQRAERPWPLSTEKATFEVHLLIWLDADTSVADMGMRLKRNSKVLEASKVSFAAMSNNARYVDLCTAFKAIAFLAHEHFTLWAALPEIKTDEIWDSESVEGHMDFDDVSDAMITLRHFRRHHDESGLRPFFSMILNIEVLGE